MEAIRKRGVARKGTILPANIAVFSEHAMLTDGTPVQPTLLGQPRTIDN
jgi:hypothetical protein